MANDYVITTNESGDLAVRTVSATEASNITDTLSVITRTDDGKLAVRTVGDSGGDQHNLGYYTTQAALEEAHPTASAGDYAIVGATDTVWIWDTDTSAWVDSDQKGQVTSVNGQTGAVTVSEVPSQTGYSGRVLGTDGFVAGWVLPERVQRDAMPQASEEEVGNIYQYVGTTDANYTNGYFYKCVSDGQDPATYSWERVDVQPAGSSLPDQTGQSGKFLTTDGTDASWSDKPLVNNATGTGRLAVGANATATQNLATSYGVSAAANSNSSIAIGNTASAQGNYSVAFGVKAQTNATGAIQINSSGLAKTNSDVNTFKVANANGNFEIMSADGTVPTARLTKVNTTATLAVADWSSNTQTVTVSGVKADSVVFVSPAPASASDYASAGILCTSQTTNSLTFTATTTPSVAIDVNIVCL